MSKTPRHLRLLNAESPETDPEEHQSQRCLERKDERAIARRFCGLDPERSWDRNDSLLVTGSDDPVKVLRLIRRWKERERDRLRRKELAKKAR